MRGAPCTGVARPRLLLAACVRCAPNIALYAAAWLQMRADVEQQQREHCFALVSLSGELWLAAESAAEKEQWVAIGGAEAGAAAIYYVVRLGGARLAGPNTD